MSLFQCDICGCVENTACSSQGCISFFADYFNWDGMEEQKGKLHCSACAPRLYADGEPTEYGMWHNRFKRSFLPLGEWTTDCVGNLEHKENKELKYNDCHITPSNDVIRRIAMQIKLTQYEQQLVAELAKEDPAFYMGLCKHGDSVITTSPEPTIKNIKSV